MTDTVPALVQLDRDEAAQRLAAAAADLLATLSPKQRGYTTLMRALTDWETTR